MNTNICNISWCLPPTGKQINFGEFVQRNLISTAKEWTSEVFIYVEGPNSIPRIDYEDIPYQPICPGRRDASGCKVWGGIDGVGKKRLDLEGAEVNLRWWKYNFIVAIVVELYI